MLPTLRTTALAAVTGVAAVSAPPAQAQSYPIDCALLLCLSHGWPASAPCAAAKAEFIRRITPWPVEPPLQIWRCPMGGGVQLQSTPAQSPWLDNPVTDAGTDPQPLPTDATTPEAVPAVLRNLGGDDFKPADPLHFVQDYTDGSGRADIDISGPTFDYVRSIRVYSVERLSQRETGGEDEYCRRFESVRVGTYGQQGSFSWGGGDPSDLPDAFVGDELWGDNCPTVSVRAVFVDWRDYQGNYGFEQVNY
ncbi:hypothetical protein SAMN04490244_11656 [Tranquillimonas rosea]|uniref:Uncharacterized protein n=1 Tax=Tranquillimonas rosea TaxID=641238 RepID=A0A1H9X1N3_9RHOB|nr:hypothetical protein [Tranquillimonas rosea]SES39999.1 hypothetical protein SAMN04490244_11656 [Tranquillimonas rosea]